MLSSVEIRSALLVGIDAVPLTIRVETRPGLPLTTFVGFREATIPEIAFRLRTNLRELAVEPIELTVTAEPAVTHDEAALDLPITLALLELVGAIPAGSTKGLLVTGELALNGQVRAVRGSVSSASLAAAERLWWLGPVGNLPEAQLAGGTAVGALSLEQVVSWLKGKTESRHNTPPSPRVPIPEVDMADLRGLPDDVLEAFIASAIDGKSLLLVGPPGSGKTMLARRMPSILPALSDAEKLEVARVWSAAGLGESFVASPARPFRAPHHSISEAGLIGGGSPVRPGEVSLAHGGVLFLDEVPELPSRVLEALKPVLKTDEARIARSRTTVTMPAKFLLIGAANPCPCGWAGDPSGRCDCPPEAIKQHEVRTNRIGWGRVVQVPSVSVPALLNNAPGRSSAEIAKQVLRGIEAAKAAEDER